DIGNLIINSCSQENDAVHHQSGKNVHLGNIQPSFFHNVRRKVRRRKSSHILIGRKAAVSKVFYREISEIFFNVHIELYLISSDFQKLFPFQRQSKCHKILYNSASISLRSS